MKKSNEEILQIIFENSTYDEEKREYQISKQLRDSLNLSKKRWKKINTICTSNGITIEYPNKPLKEIKKVELFEKYNEIKFKIDNKVNPLELENLEKERVEIRNKIATANLELINEIINRRINGKNNLLEINNGITKEDLYQYGYEVLLHYLDIHYLYKETIKRDLNDILILHIQNKMSKDYGYCTEYLIKLKKLKKYLNNLSSDIIDIKLLSKQLQLPTDTIINLLNLENIENPINIDNIELIDDTLEEDIFNKNQQEQLLKIIDTLSTETQRQTIILTYGLNGEEEHTNEDIANKLNMVPTSVYGTKNNALKRLREPARLEYLKRIMGIEKETSFDIYKEIFSPSNIDLRQLEKLLLLSLDKEELLKLIEPLNEKYKISLLLYLNYMDYVDKEYQEKVTFYKARKEKSLSFLRNRIEELYVQNNQNENIQNYFDYLMHNYLNKPKKLYRTK